MGSWAPYTGENQLSELAELLLTQALTVFPLTTVKTI
jgi:hypothetical protein